MCWVFAERRSAIHRTVRPGGNFVEVGTLTGAFARFLIRSLKPHSLTVMDISPFAIKNCLTRTKDVGAQSGSIVHCIKGNSAQALEKMAHASQDLIYIDGDHNYKGVCADLEAARSKIRVGGFLVVNDYHWFETDFLALRGRWGVYGVIHALNEFVIRYSDSFEVAYYALHGRNQGDLALKKVRE
ncbi:MAG: hypothetical protein SGPRY_000830 [Prymnesium sp.]